MREALIRLQCATPPRRCFPARLGFALGELAASVAQGRDHPGYRVIVEYQRQLLEHTPRAGEEEETARRMIAELVAVLEIFFRPWLFLAPDAEGLAHLRDAEAEGRGAIISFLHHGIPYAMLPVMAHHRFDAWFIAGPQHHDAPAPGYAGRIIEHARRYIVATIGMDHTISRQGSTFPVVLDLLERRKIVSVAFDMPGSMPTPFMGRRIALASGTAQLAFQTGAPIVPVLTGRRGTRPVVTFAEPIDPRAHESPEAIQAAVAAVASRWTLEAPHTAWPLLDLGAAPLAGGVALAADPPRA